MFPAPRIPYELHSHNHGAGADAAHRRRSHALRAIALAMLVPVAGAAANPGFTYSDFAAPSGMSTRGAAALADGALRLTPASPQLSGAAWHTAKVPVVAGFTSTFGFRASGMGGSGDATGHVGADGFAFVIQPVSSSAVVLGANGRGGNIGYATLPRAVVLEFDTWFNAASPREPNGHHIALVSGGLAPINAATDTIDVDSLGENIADGVLHDITVEYDGSTLDVIVDDHLAFSSPINIGAKLGLTDGLAYVGFTAATGGGWQNHDITRWQFVSVPSPGAAGMLGLGAAAMMRRRRTA